MTRRGRRTEKDGVQIIMPRGLRERERERKVDVCDRLIVEVNKADR